MGGKACRVRVPKRHGDDLRDSGARQQEQEQRGGR